MVIIQDDGAIIYRRIEENPETIVYLGFIPEKHYMSLIGQPSEILMEGLMNAELIKKDRNNAPTP